MTKGKDTKETILISALSIVSQSGLEGLSIGKLAQTVGLSKSGLFAHFNSLENLQLAVLQKAVDIFIETVIVPALKQPRGEPRICAISKNLFEWDRKFSGGCPFFSISAELDDKPGVVRDFLVSTQKDFVSTIANMAQIAITEGHFRKDLNPQQFAYDFYAIVLCHHHFDRLLNDPLAQNYYLNAFKALIKNSH
ncbi:MAG: TetR/AcrR family transcriptional regulator [Acidobacteria bacterium]|nr:TetR/AcrR family transcriptional regulator [Acidobacteriota bacterium]